MRSKGTIGLLVVLLLVAFGGCAGCSTYNSLVAEEEVVNEAFSFPSIHSHPEGFFFPAFEHEPEDIPEGGVYAVDFSSDGKRVAAGGFDGNVRLIDASSGKILKQFTPVEIQPATVAVTETEN